MTKEEFELLQLDLRQSGKSIKSYLQYAGIGYSTYNYWRKKFAEGANPRRDLAPISFTGLTESTVDGWFKQTVELLRPLYDALEAEVMNTGYAQADETTTPVIDRDSHKAAKEYVWMVRAVVERLVLFHYDQGSRAGAVIEALAKRHGFKGYLQCDGFGGYETAFRGNHDAAKNMTVICSLLATCRNHDVNPRDYLNDVIGRMPYQAKATHNELVHLLPHKWKLQHPESIMTKTT